MSTINLAAYCSGDFGPGITNECIGDAQQSGFTTLILWAMHIGRAGDLNNSNCQAVPGQSWGELVFNDGNIRITDGDTFNPNNDADIAAWPSKLAQLKQHGSKVEKIFISIGGWGVCDFQAIEYMLEKGMREQIKANFKTLREAFTVDGECLIDGVDFDNEEVVKASTITEFAEILFDLGYQVTFCPYQQPSLWQGYMQTLWDKGYRVSWWNLQCYSGGLGNLERLQPWLDALSAVVGEGQGGAYLVAGLAVKGASDSNPELCPSAFCQSFAAVSEQGLAGGFIWKYDAVLSNKSACDGAVPTAASYSKAITQGLNNDCP
ncbi:hypothetical protein ABMY44_01415 [Pseudoalteromonas sp. Cnat2-41]|uniref:hypothetical protein n=1 Tax=unclassified Pseudoalteromonas TaxID=194690 RepID=UPI001EF8E427|nr:MULTISPECIES: hypothetical protein [unclassified Pseudoalteromonas]MCF2860821.1 hypothetical protein [Pseudoalteromonas sp. CNAT2-18]MCG7556690.1 hypothetical protein [Pseudoalteromonas sp. CNAT2-18.1]